MRLGVFATGVVLACPPSPAVGVSTSPAPPSTCGKRVSDTVLGFEILLGDVGGFDEVYLLVFLFQLVSLLQVFPLRLVLPQSRRHERQFILSSEKLTGIAKYLQAFFSVGIPLVGVPSVGSPSTGVFPSACV